MRSSAITLARGLMDGWDASDVTSALASSEAFGSKGQHSAYSSNVSGTWSKPASHSFARSYAESLRPPERFRTEADVEASSGSFDGEDSLHRMHFPFEALDKSLSRNQTHAGKAPRMQKKLNLDMRPHSAVTSGLSGNRLFVEQADSDLLRADGPFRAVARSTPRKASHISAGDGAEVVALLKSPCAGEEGEVTGFQLRHELQARNFAEVEKLVVDSIKAGLPAPAEHRPVSPHNPLNLRPHVEKHELANISSQCSSETGAETAHAFINHDSRRGDEASNWFTDQGDVLNRYTDEVWGYSLPALKEARAAVQKVRENGADQPGAKTLGRLTMILGHLEATLSGNGAQASSELDVTKSRRLAADSRSNELQSAWTRARSGEVASAESAAQRAVPSNLDVDYLLTRINWLAERTQPASPSAESLRAMIDVLHRISAAPSNSAAKSETLNEFSHHFLEYMQREMGEHKALLGSHSFEVPLRSRGSQQSKVLETQRDIGGPVREVDREVTVSSPDNGQNKAEEVDEGIDGQISIDPFHCPFPSCHERLYSAMQLRIHRKDVHNGGRWTINSTRAAGTDSEEGEDLYPCAHVGCQARFSDLGDWAEHIKCGHHDLLSN